jgi:hypothetical protein
MSSGLTKIERTRQIYLESWKRVGFRLDTNLTPRTGSGCSSIDRRCSTIRSHPDWESMHMSVTAVATIASRLSLLDRAETGEDNWSDDVGQRNQGTTEPNILFYSALKVQYPSSFNLETECSQTFPRMLSKFIQL